MSIKELHNLTKFIVVTIKHHGTTQIADGPRHIKKIFDCAAQKALQQSLAQFVAQRKKITSFLYVFK